MYSSSFKNNKLKEKYIYKFNKAKIEDLIKISTLKYKTGLNFLVQSCDFIA